MEIKQSQTFFHGTYSNLTPYLFLSKHIKVFQWLSKSKFLSFLTKVNPNNENKRKSDIFPWGIFKHHIISFLSKNIELFQWLSDFKFLSFMTEVNEAKSNVFHSNLTSSKFHLKQQLCGEEHQYTTSPFHFFL